MTDGKETAGRVYAFAWAAWEHGDFAIALDAAREAARMGELQACRFVAPMYAAGEGVPRDPHRAARRLRFAAERGHAGCQAELGRRYEHREGVPRDDVEACFWFSLAAAKVEHPDVCPTTPGDRERVAKRLGEADRERVRARVRSWRMRQRLRRTCGRLAAPFLALRRDLVARAGQRENRQAGRSRGSFPRSHRSPSPDPLPPADSSPRSPTAPSTAAGT